jgi:hypothetical protein
MITWPGKNIYTVDLAKLTAANGGLEPGNATPWTQNPIRHFRIDPFEFGNEQITFHMDNVKLAADDETANNSFTIKWIGSDADPGDSPTVALYYQLGGGSYTLIAAGIPLSAGQYNWNTSGVPAGTYNIIAVASDALNSTVQYATGPLKVSSFAAPTNPFIDFDTPREGYVVTSSFEVGGWAVDLGAPTGTGVDAVQFYVFPNNGASPGVFMGWGTYGLARPDVGAFFGSSQFTNSGFHFTITGLGPGAYVLGAYGRSTVTGGYTLAKTIHFTVNANQLMAVSPPAAEATISGNIFAVDGWSIDRSVESTGISGSGVDTLHVYAYPNPGSGAPPIFVGVATYGLSRPDVAGIYGARYGTSGYHLSVDRAARGLTNGPYNIVVFSHSTVTGTFNNLAVVRVTLQ